jgi:large subunit ribosomal protein L35
LHSRFGEALCLNILADIARLNQENFLNSEGVDTMPKTKIKTHRGAAKRFNLTKNGKVKMNKAFRRHILNKKTTKRKRHLRKQAYCSKANAAVIKKLIP